MSEHDRRTFALTLTEDGRRLLGKLPPLALGFEAELLARQTEVERAALDHPRSQSGDREDDKGGIEPDASFSGRLGGSVP